MALTNVQKVRTEVADTDPTLPILPDETYDYLLEKNYNNIGKSALDAARIILMHLSQRTNETVDIFSIKGADAANQYRQALILFMKDPSSNPLLQNVQGWFGGVSISQMNENDNNSDNNIIKMPSQSYIELPSSLFSV